MEMLQVGDIVWVMTEDELMDRIDEDGMIDGLLWVRDMDCVLGEEVSVSKIHLRDDAYSKRRFDYGYYEFSVTQLPSNFHLNPSMLHTGTIEVPNINEADWSSVAFC